MSKESAYFIIGNPRNTHEVKQLMNYLNRLPGILSTSINLSHTRLAVDYDNTGVNHTTIENKVRGLGYDIMQDSAENRLT